VPEYELTRSGQFEGSLDKHGLSKEECRLLSVLKKKNIEEINQVAI
jgi:hypothetical protein